MRSCADRRSGRDGGTHDGRFTSGRFDKAQCRIGDPEATEIANDIAAIAVTVIRVFHQHLVDHQIESLGDLRVQFAAWGNVPFSLATISSSVFSPVNGSLPVRK